MQNRKKTFNVSILLASCLLVLLFSTELQAGSRRNQYDEDLKRKEEEAAKQKAEDLKRKEEEAAKQKAEDLKRKEGEEAEKQKVEKRIQDTAKLFKCFDTLLESFPLVNWLNVKTIDNLIQPATRTLMTHEEYFNAIDSLGQYGLSVGPYVLSSNFSVKDSKFNLKSLGIIAKGDMVFQDIWELGLEVGCWHSSLNQHVQSASKKVNHKGTSLYISPSISYRFKTVFTNFSLVGIRTSYNEDIRVEYKFKNFNDKWETLPSNLKLSSFHIKGKRLQWDIGCRIGGGIDLEIPHFWQGTFFLQPTANFTYLWTHQATLAEKTKGTSGATGDNTNDTVLSIEIGPRDFHFFRSCLVLSTWKEFQFKETGFLIPAFSLGWVGMFPLSQGQLLLKGDNLNKEGVTTNKITTEKYPSAQLVYLGAKVTALHKRGIALAVGGEALLGDPYHVYVGTLQIDFDW